MNDNWQPKAKERLRMEAELGLQAREMCPHLNNEADVQEFVGALEKRRPDMIMGFPSQETFNYAMHSFHMAWIWSKNGCPVLRLTHGLAAALMLTEPPDLKGEELKLPFPVFCIHIPSGIIPIYNRHNEQQWADLIWVYRFLGRHFRFGSTDFIRWTAQYGQTEVWRDRYPKNLDDEDDEKLYSLLPGEPAPGKEDQISLVSSLRLIKNLCFWLEGTRALEKIEPSKKKKPKTKKASKKAYKGPPVTTYVLGREVKVQSQLRDMASEIALGRTRNAPSGWKLRLRHVVHGHWKNQAHGKGLKLRKRIWVEPYWRGPEGEEAWKHLKENKQKN